MEICNEWTISSRQAGEKTAYFSQIWACGQIYENNWYDNGQFKLLILGGMGKSFLRPAPGFESRYNVGENTVLALS